MKELIRPVLSGLSQAISDSGSDLGILIAGGALRDLHFEMHPRDFDVFVDTSTIAAEDRDDTVLLLADDIWSRFRKICPQYVAFGNGLRKQEAAEESYEGVVDNTGGGLYHIYAGPAFSLHAPVEEDVVERNDDRDWDWYNPSIQFIGRPQKEISQDHDGFVSLFDYDLVRCYHNPYTDETVYTEAFLKTVKTGRVHIKDEKTNTRFTSWAGRKPSRTKQLKPILGYDPKPKNEMETLYNKTMNETYGELLGLPRNDLAFGVREQQAIDRAAQDLAQEVDREIIRDIEAIAAPIQNLNMRQWNFHEFVNQWPNLP